MTRLILKSANTYLSRSIEYKLGRILTIGDILKWILKIAQPQFAFSQRVRITDHLGLLITEFRSLDDIF